MTPKQRIFRESLLTAAHKDYEKSMTQHAFFKTSNHTTSDDLVQDTFIKTWAYLVKGGKIQGMKSFLYHVLNNLIVDEYRRRKNKNASLDVLVEVGFEPSADPSQKLFNVLDGKAALLTIQRLPLSYQKIMRMRYVQSLSLEEMSAITGLSKNTIAVQLHRGLAKLKLLYHALH